MEKLRALMALGVLAVLSPGCCSTEHCRNTSSGADQERTSSPRLRLDLIHNDSVSYDLRDRTDWKHVMLTTPGKLSVFLHWDSGEAHLALDLFDAMGITQQEGRPWGPGSLRAVLAVEQPGNYYIRVQARGRGDASRYALRATFEPGGPPPSCSKHHCKAGERICLGATSVGLCERLSPSCSAWTRSADCPPGVLCSAGSCSSCAEPCHEGERRCRDGAAQLCEVAPIVGCATWSRPEQCASGRCQDGRCVVKAPPRTGRDRRPATSPSPPAPREVLCQIISLYRRNGQLVLHLECPPAPVAPGQVGHVLDGATDRLLPGGEVKVTRVQPPYAIVLTTLQVVGNNRRVRIQLTP